jgi:hypothetical protein
MELVPCREAPSSSAAQEFSNIVCNRRILLWSLSGARQILSISYLFSLTSILILSFHLRLDLPSVIPPFWFSRRHFICISLSIACCMYIPSNPWLNLSNCIWRNMQVVKLLVMQFSPASCYIISCVTQHWINRSYKDWALQCEGRSKVQDFWTNARLHFFFSSQNYPTTSCANIFEIFQLQFTSYNIAP